MKKILSLLTAMTLTASVGSNVVACKTKQSSQATIDEQKAADAIKNKIQVKDLGIINYQENKTLNNNLGNLKKALNKVNNDRIKDNELARITFQNNNRNLIADGTTENQISLLIQFGSVSVVLGGFKVKMASPEQNNNIINALLNNIPAGDREIKINYRNITTDNWINNDVKQLLKNKLSDLYKTKKAGITVTNIDNYMSFLNFTVSQGAKPTPGNSINVKVQIISGTDTKNSINLKLDMETEQNTINNIYSKINNIADKKIVINFNKNKSINNDANKKSANLVLQKDKNISKYSLPYISYEKVNLTYSEQDVKLTIKAPNGTFTKNVYFKIKMNEQSKLFKIDRTNIPNILKPEIDRVIDVFGIKIYGCIGVADSKMIFAANVMAQYIDNNADGKPDNPLLLKTMVDRKAGLIMWKNQSAIETILEKDGGVNIQQDLGDDETRPSWHQNGQTGQFDASLEEIWHLICSQGYNVLWPYQFGTSWNINSDLTKAMDKARGGKFKNIPSKYPDSAYYTYSDETCDYACQAYEYYYWVMSSYLGAQKNRGDEINEEWKLNTTTKIKVSDYFYKDFLSKVNSIDSTKTNLEYYSLPTKLPDGQYIPQIN